MKAVEQRGAFVHRFSAAGQFFRRNAPFPRCSGVSDEMYAEMQLICLPLRAHEESALLFACVLERSQRCSQTRSCHPWESHCSETVRSPPSQYFTAAASDSHLQHYILNCCCYTVYVPDCAPASFCMRQNDSSFFTLIVVNVFKAKLC